MGILSVFKRACPGDGKQAQQGYITWNKETQEHAGSCPECGKVKPCDPYSIMLPHRK